ncbi:MAG TPA: hypothetical protein VNO81_14125 [Candidatus Nitrosotenuis sp.]|nr:hypothetical protein [Candidatus Nitrosotenuis sp.]
MFIHAMPGGVSFGIAQPAGRRAVSSLEPAVHPEITKRLIQGGLEEKHLVKDIRKLREENAEAALLASGFRLETSEKANPRSYVLGTGHLFGLGQRALFYQDGSVGLVSFANQFVQIIEMNPEGVVKRNVTQRLDR